MSNITAKLLSMESRRTTLAPEIVGFFSDDEKGLRRFLRTFGGATITVPGPGLLKEIQRDEKIASELLKNDSAETRLRMIKEHKVTFEHLADVFIAAMDRQMTRPMDCVDPLSDAVALARKHRRDADIIAKIFDLSPSQKGMMKQRVKA